jgi:uncharacterized protein
VTWPDALLLFVAGIAAGLSGSIAGLSSLFSYPALLAVGLPALTANVTNTVALTFSSLGSVIGSRPELRGQNHRRLAGFTITAIAGGIGGALLLILTPADAFERVIPVIIALASLAILLPRRRVHDDQHVHRDPWWLIPAIFGVGVYGGYFGAAAGTLLLAVFLVATSDALARCNALKNLVLGAANGVAAIIFAVSSHVDWAAVPPLAIGLFIGSLCGPVVVRHAPVRPLRWLIAMAGVGLAIRLGLQEYT